MEYLAFFYYFGLDLALLPREVINPSPDLTKLFFALKM